MNFTDPTGHVAEGGFKIGFKQGLRLVEASLNAMAILNGDETLEAISSAFSLFVTLYDKFFKPKQTEADTDAAKKNKPILDKLGAKRDVKGFAKQILDLDLGESVESSNILESFLRNIAQFLGFSSNKAIEVTIITEDNKVIQYSAKAGESEQVIKVLYAYQNAKELGLKVMLTTVNDGQRILKSASNVDDSIKKNIGKVLTQKVFEEFATKIGLNDYQIVGGLFKKLFPGKIGRIGKKVIGTGFFIFDAYNMYTENKELIDKYASKAALDYSAFSLVLTSHPDSRLISRFMTNVQWEGETNEQWKGKALTYSNLVYAAKKSLGERAPHLSLNDFVIDRFNHALGMISIAL